MLLSSEFRPCEARFEEMFAATLTGQEHDFALVFVHGFLGRGDDWHEVTERLCVNFQCLTIDLPGHGNSQHIEVKGFNDTVEGLIKTILKHIKVPFFLVGYSLGARLSMYLCAKKFLIFDDKPCTLLGLFIESGHPGLTDVDRKPRQDNDEAWARRFEQAPLLNVLEQWYSQPVFFSENFDKKQKLIKKRSDNLGEKVASMLRATSLSKQPCLRDELVRCGVPFYFIFGNDDQKFASIGQSLGCECHGVNNAGHNVHNEQPELFSGLIRKLVKKTRIKTSDVKNAHLQIINNKKGKHHGKNNRINRARALWPD